MYTHSTIGLQSPNSEINLPVPPFQAALDEAARAGWAVLLATQEERNVVFYNRLG